MRQQEQAQEQEQSRRGETEEEGELAQDSLGDTALAGACNWMLDGMRSC